MWPGYRIRYAAVVVVVVSARAVGQTSHLTLKDLGRTTAYRSRVHDLANACHHAVQRVDVIVGGLSKFGGISLSTFSRGPAIPLPPRNHLHPLQEV